MNALLATPTSFRHHIVGMPLRTAYCVSPSQPSENDPPSQTPCSSCEDADDVHPCEGILQVPFSLKGATIFALVKARAITNDHRSQQPNQEARRRVGNTGDAGACVYSPLCTRCLASVAPVVGFSPPSCLCEAQEHAPSGHLRPWSMGMHEHVIMLYLSR